MKKETTINTGKVVTFYSYKGGTGRSMALANIACLLAQDGKKVLMIDWDLEAPGLIDYFKEYIKNTEEDFSQNVGLIEFMQKAVDTLPPMPLDEENEEEIDAFFEQINDYILPIEINANENLFLMKAGKMDETYSERIAALDWSAFFEKIPVFFTRFAFFLRKKYDFVLIDSRTGHTDTGGICTMLMPEKLVLAFTPNDQSLNGVLKLAKRATDYRINSDDLRPLEMYPLASRFDIDEDQMRKDWKKRYVHEFGELFKEIYALPDDTSFEKYFDEVQIRHVSKYTYGEKIAVLEEGNDLYSITAGYQNLKEYFDKSVWSYEEYVREEEIVEEVKDNKILNVFIVNDYDDPEHYSTLPIKDALFFSYEIAIPTLMTTHILNTREEDFEEKFIELFAHCDVYVRLITRETLWFRKFETPNIIQNREIEQEIVLMDYKKILFKDTFDSIRYGVFHFLYDDELINWFDDYFFSKKAEKLKEKFNNKLKTTKK